MKENLIFGADILSFGAVNDGKTDCTKAFECALGSNKNLITVPYGEYLIKKPLKIGSNTKLHLHPAAKLIFDVDWTDISGNDCALISNADGACSVIISGGTWIVKNGAQNKNTCIFGFNSTENIRINDAVIKLESLRGIFLKEVKDFRIENLRFVCDTDTTLPAVISDSCQSGSVRNLSYSCTKMPSENSGVIEFYGKNSGIFINNAHFDSAPSFVRVKDSAVLDDIQIYSLSGSFGYGVLDVCKDCNVEYALICDIDAFCITATPMSAYFRLCGKLDTLVIENFKRDSFREALPAVPSAITENTETDLIIDGLMLDEIINAKACSKIKSMLPARLSNPHGKFVYTLETSLDKNDSFVIPNGSFDSFEAAGK